MPDRVDRRVFLKRSTALGAVALFGREFSGTLIVVHGYNGAPTRDMYAAMSQRAPLELNLLTQVPDLPLSNKDNLGSNPKKFMDPESASLQVATLIKQVKTPVVLLGHSLGVNIALYTLSQYQIVVDGALLVAGRYQTPSGDVLLETKCYNRLLLPSVIRRNIQGPFIATNSLGDTVVIPPEENLANIARTFGAKPIPTTGKGHFDSPEHATFLIDILKREILPFVGSKFQT